MALFACLARITSVGEHRDKKQKSDLLGEHYPFLINYCNALDGNSEGPNIIEAIKLWTSCVAQRDHMFPLREAQTPLNPPILMLVNYFNL